MFPISFLFEFTNLTLMRKCLNSLMEQLENRKALLSVKGSGKLASATIRYWCEYLQSGSVAVPSPS